MARKKAEKIQEVETVEDLAQEFFEREKAAYEERTGEKVEYVPPTPLTSTPIPAEPEAAETETAETESDETDNAATDAAESDAADDDTDSAEGDE